MDSRISPCGADCSGCERYPNECAGCREIKGRVWWLEYTGKEVCEFYKCCFTDRKLPHCGRCAELPCHLFLKGDPTKSDAENSQILKDQLKSLTSN